MFFFSQNKYFLSVINLSYIIVYVTIFPAKK